MAKLPRKVSAVPRRPREAVRTAPSRAAGLYVGRARSPRRRLQQQPRELRGGSGDGQAPPRPGRDGSPRAGRWAGEGLAEGSPQAGWAGSLGAGSAGRAGSLGAGSARSPQQGQRGAGAARLLVSHGPEAGKGPGRGRLRRGTRRQEP